MTTIINNATDPCVPSNATMRELMAWVRVAYRAVKTDVTPDCLAAQVPKAQLAETVDALSEAAQAFAALAHLCADGHEIMQQAMARSGLRLAVLE
jgi:hypothetical protein